MSKTSLFPILLLVAFLLSCNRTVISEGAEENNREQHSPKTFEDVNDLASILKREVEAKGKSDHLALANIYLDKVRYFHLNRNRDSMLFYAYLGDQELNAFLEKTPNPNSEQTDLYVSLKNNMTSSIIDNYLSTNKHNLALIYLKKLTAESHSSIKSTLLDAQMYYLLGLTYIHSKKAEKAMECFQQGYNLLQKSPNNPPYSYYLYFKGMIHAMMRLENYDKMIALSDSVNRMVDREQAILGEKDYLYHLIKYAIYYESGGTYVKMGDLKKAREMLDEANKVLTENLKDTPHKFIHFQIESLYYVAIKDYSKAKEYIEHYFEYAKNQKGEDGIYNFLEASLLKSEIMRQAGEIEEAYDLLNELYALNDSTNTANFSAQVAEIESIYQVDKMKLEAERNQEELQRMQLVVITSLLITSLLIYIVYSYRRNSKTLKEKNLQLYKKFSELERNDQQIKELQKNNTNFQRQLFEAKDPYDSLIYNLNTYLIESQMYKNPDISREELALAVGTNRQYLIEAIKEKTGKTFNEYIYSFRLKYAFDLIVKDKEKKISEIFLEAGFLSNATFYRAFKEEYGMTPSELRNVS